MMGRRVVVTGMGAITPVGKDVDSTWHALVRGQSGVACALLVDISDLDVKIAGEVKDFDPTDYLDKKEARRMDRFLQLGMVAAKEAVRDARLTLKSDDAESIGVLVGSGIGGINTIVDGDRTSPWPAHARRRDMRLVRRRRSSNAATPRS